MTGPLRMTAARRVFLAVGTPIALLIIGWAALSAVAWAAQGSFRVNRDVATRDRLV